MSEVEIGMMVTLACEIRLEDDTLIECFTAESPLIVDTGDPNLLAGLIKNIKSMNKGEKKSFTLDFKEAYGPHDPSLMQKLPREFFGADQIENDDVVIAETEDGQEIPLLILEVGPTEVLVDFNHPLSGKNLVFNVEILDISQAKI